MSDTQGLSPAASSHSPVPRAKKDSFQKPRQAPCKSAKDSSMRAASSGKIQSTAYATQRTYQQWRLFYKEDDHTEQITSSSCTMTRSPKISTREQKHARKMTSVQGKTATTRCKVSKTWLPSDQTRRVHVLVLDWQRNILHDNPRKQTKPTSTKSSTRFFKFQCGGFSCLS